MVFYNTGSSVEKVPFSEERIQEGELVVADKETISKDMLGSPLKISS